MSYTDDEWNPQAELDVDFDKDLVLSDETNDDDLSGDESGIETPDDDDDSATSSDYN